MEWATFQVVCLGEAGWTGVEVCGELDMAVVHEFERVLSIAIRASSTGDVVAELSGVTFLDCAGVSALVRARRELGSQFWLAHPSAPVMHVLDLVGLRESFPVLDIAPARRPIHPSEAVRHGSTDSASSEGSS